MKFPTNDEVARLITRPEYFAECMTIFQIDNVIAGLIDVRNTKERWYESHK